MSDLQELIRRKSVIENAGGRERTDRQHAAGGMTARERLGRLFDAGSFAEGWAFSGPDMVCGSGRVEGRTVFAFAQDATLPGDVTPDGLEKACRAVASAAGSGSPVVALLDSRCSMGPAALAGQGRLAAAMLRARGRVPVLCAVMGHCAGFAACLAETADLVLMTRETSELFLDSPDALQSLSGESVTAGALGGAELSATRNASADLIFDSDPELLDKARALLGLLPSGAPAVPSDDVNRLTPSLEALPQGYAMAEVVSACADAGTAEEIGALDACGVLTAFARFAGRAAGVVANDPRRFAGRLSEAGCRKAARFIDLCARRGLPVVTFADTQGFLPTLSEARAGNARAAALLAQAYVSAAVPKVTLVVGGAYGAAGVLMGSRALGADIVYALPSARAAVQPGGEDGPYEAAQLGEFDDVIHPAMARRMLIAALNLCAAGTAPAPQRRAGTHLL